MAVLTSARRAVQAAASILSALLAAVGPAGAQTAPPQPAASPAIAATAVTASAHRVFGTASAPAQAAFDRGLVMLYAFNIGEAADQFVAAERADPHAILPYVGEAVSQTFDINLPTTAAGEQRGADAVARGRRMLTPATAADERELLAAVGQRFDGRASHDARFRAYSTALQAYTAAHPSDALGFTLAAYAGWNATGALTQAPADALTPDAQQIAGAIDAALRLDPADLGAHHLRIHFWEQAHLPERALPDADYLAGVRYDPGQSHLVHMAGHIYDRLGDYDAMVRVNEGACGNDDAYFRSGDGDGQRYMRTYHEHDVSFVLYGLTAVGRNADASAFAARESDYSRELVALRTHDNAAVLRLLGAAITPMRAIAEARSGDLDAARRDLAGLTHGGGSPGGVEHDIAAAVVARAGHDTSAAVAAYQRALAASGDDLGDPKTSWWTPIGEGLGATLLEAGQSAEAERVFRAELARYPKDPRLEYGLAQALAAQGKDDAAPRAAARAHWRGATPLTPADLG